MHAEPGEDKITFADDVAKWILDRASQVAGAVPRETAAAGPIKEAARTTGELRDPVEAKSRL